MTSTEKQLFDLIDNARVDNGCARLKQDPSLTGGARSTASDRAASGQNLNSGTGAGGNKMTAQQAYNRLMKNAQSTVLNCGLTALGVGFDSKQTCTLLIICTDRNAWVAKFS
ncbi:spore germination YkwD domain-containing protein [Kribbella solani]|uniref:hypothetical protein n=1 Tax=Kribbella solani TaxID=236067 RepID=UPI0029BBAD6A|nr:hypothetical protein [Kribbella solani]MDX2967590.1 hypothetical protein [Kribbella solani]